MKLSTRVPLLLISLALAACSGDDDDDEPDGAGLAGSCFYSCPVAVGMNLYGCRSTSEQQDCATTTEEKCGSNPATSEFLSGCASCDEGCAPDWYTP